MANVNTQGFQSPHGLVHVDQFLTDFSIKYRNAALIADEVCPPIDVKKRTDVYPIYGRESMRIEDDTVAPRANVNQTDSYTVTSYGSYICQKHALKDRVDWSERDCADDPLSPDLDVTQNLTDKILLAKELRVARMYTTAANWTPVATISGVSYTGALNVLSDLGATYQWDNASFDSTKPNTQIKAIIDAAKTAVRKQIGVDPNTIIIPDPIAKVMSRDKTFVDLIRYTHADLASNGDLPPVLWNMNVKIPMSIMDTAERGKTFKSGDVWGNNIVVAYVAPNPRSPRTFTATMGFRYKPFWVTKETHITDEYDEVCVSEVRDERVTSSSCAFLIQNPIT